MFCDLLRLSLPLDDVFVLILTSELGESSEVSDAEEKAVEMEEFPCVLHPVHARVNRVKHTRKLVVEHRANYVMKDSAIGHFPHIKTRSHLNSEVNVWRGPLVLALDAFLEQNLEKVRRGCFFGTKFGEGAPRVLFWNKIWRRCAEGTFLEQNLEKVRRGYFFGTKFGEG